MNRFSTLFLLFVCCCYSLVATAQSKKKYKKCKVLKTALTGDYQGDCRKGLASGEGIAQGEDRYEGVFKKGQPHGQGKYTYANGDFYIGEFKNGVRHGEGKMYVLSEAVGKTIAPKLALWKKDEFVSNVMEQKYKIIRKRNILNIKALKQNEQQERITLRMGTKANNIIEDVDLYAPSGIVTNITYKDFLIDNPQFPITLTLRYKWYAPASSSSPNDAELQIKLESPGEWLLELN